jgi:enoyl-CoA hydratase/carnithine racemase
VAVVEEQAEAEAVGVAEEAVGAEVELEEAAEAVVAEVAGVVEAEAVGVAEEAVAAEEVAVVAAAERERACHDPVLEKPSAGRGTRASCRRRTGVRRPRRHSAAPSRS